LHGIGVIIEVAPQRHERLAHQTWGNQQCTQPNQVFAFFHGQ